jgi:hypothetical protein
LDKNKSANIFYSMTSIPEQQVEALRPHLCKDIRDLICAYLTNDVDMRYVIECNQSDAFCQKCGDAQKRYCIFHHLERPRRLDVCLEAARLYPSCVRYFYDDEERVFMQAVQQDCNSIQFIHRPSDTVCRAAVAKDGRVIYYIQNQTRELCLAALAQDVRAIGTIRNQTSEVCWLALQKDVKIYPLIKSPNLLMSIYALYHNWHLLVYVLANHLGPV